MGEVPGGSNNEIGWKIEWCRFIKGGQLLAKGGIIGFFI
jgi:hypothetical protein